MTGAGGAGGGIYQGHGDSTLSFVSAVGNSASTGAGIIKESGLLTILSLDNIMLQGNIGGDCAGPMVSLDHNFSNDTSCTNFTQTNDVTNTVLAMSPLQFNGGATFTHMPLAGNPAINGGDCTLSAVSDDQRGADCPGGAACDAGAVESDGLLPWAYLPLMLK